MVTYLRMVGFVLALFFSLSGTNIFATDALGTNGDKASVDVGKEEMQNENENESESNRNGKLASVLFESGSAVFPMPTSGVKGGYFLSPNGLAEISSVSGALKISGVSLDVSLLSLGYKMFLGNSFYLHGGFAQRTIKFAVTSSEYTLSADAQSTALEFQIGNRWQWSGFTLGCTWLGYVYPLSSSSTKSIPTIAEGSSSAKDLDDSLDMLAETPNVEFLRISLGWSF